MAVIKITNFGGEFPRVSARALPADAAQINQNLLATSTEFRPLLGDSTVGTAVTGAKSLFRLSRNSSGVLRSDDTSGWITGTVPKSYVRGQINDDATERTYVSFDDGSQAPRVIDAQGVDRLLGVPAPATFVATLDQVASFVQEEATAWQDTTLLPGLVSAVLGQLVETPSLMHTNADGSVPLAGPYSNHGMYWIGAGQTDYWNLRYNLDKTVATAKGLNDPRLAPQYDGTALVLRITALPAWGKIGSDTALKAAIRTLLHPVTGVQLFSESLVTSFAAEMASRFNPAGVSIQGARDQLDATVKDFALALANSLTPTATELTRPTAPSKPTVDEYTYESTGSGDSISSAFVRDPLWVAYDALLATYELDMEAYRKSGSVVTTERQARIAKIVELQARAEGLSHSIERAYIAARDGLEASLKEFLRERNYYFGQSGEVANTVKIDPDRIIDSRFYFATFTTSWGEESAPSPLATVTGRTDGMLEVDQYSTATLARPTVPGSRDITEWTLYRSNVGNSSTAFQRVTSLPVATTSYTDAIKSDQLGEVCPTITWAEPPAGLRGLVGMPNGIMAGFETNYVAFCDPYHPYAWPVEYQIPLKYPVVGLGVFGQSVFVGTLANPSIISGSDSGSMSEQILDDAQACESARSIVSADGGVLYASPDGICFASGSGVQVITTALFSREDWQKLTPSSITAAMNEGVYYFWFSGTYGGVTGGCLALDTVAKKMSRVDMTATAVFADSLTDAVFYTTGTQIKRAFSTGRRMGKWRTGKLVMPGHAPLAWIQVDGDQTVGTTVTVRWYGDGVLRHTATLTDTMPQRLPAGRYLEHEIEIESEARITKVMLAGQTLELQQA